MALECPACKSPLSASDTKCPSCGGAVPGDAEETVALAQPRTPPPSGWSTPSGPAGTQTLNPGTVLGGRYEILAVLGLGGMGAVYKARDREVDRVVALKAIRPELAGNREILERFKKELVLARQITHRNIARVYDLGVADGVKFITMEYIEGRELDRVLKELGKFRADEALPIMLQVARALEAAHAQGVIHRDLKPQNVMLAIDGRVAVMDFGIAHADSSLSPDTEPLTQAGFLLGTPKYMSPEQARGERVDARSDIFSAGIMFYELLTGRQPQDSPTPQTVLVRRITEQVRPPITQDPGVSKGLSDITARCLEMDLAKRYQTSGELLRDLEQFSGDRGRGPGKWIWLAAGIAVLAVAGAVAVWRRSAQPAPPPPVPARSASVEPAAPPAVPPAVPVPAAPSSTAGAPAASKDAPERPERAERPEAPEKPPVKAPAPAISSNVAAEFARARQLRAEGNLAEAERAYQAVLKTSASMPPKEQHQARGEYDLLQHDPQAIVEFQAAEKAAPGDRAALSGLAAAYCDSGDVSRALDAAQRGLKGAPQEAALRSQAALYQAYAGDGEKAQAAAKALTLSNPAFEPGYMVLAIAALTHHGMPGATEAYQKLQTVSRVGKSMAAEGLADIAMAKGRYKEALSILEPAVAADIAGHDARAAFKMILLAQVAQSQGDLTKAQIWADRATDASRDAAVLEPAAEIYVEAGNEAKAEALAARLDAQPSPLARAYALIVRGLARLHRQEGPAAVKLFESSAQVAATWLADYHTGRAQLQMEHFVKANQAFTRCMQGWAPGADLFMRIEPTGRYFPLVIYYVARAREGVKLPGAPAFYRQFLNLRAEGDQDALVVDAKKRWEELKKGQ